MEKVICDWGGPIECDQCGHSQEIISKETEFCLSCGRQLVIYCRGCHFPNLRDSERCSNCRKQFHRPRMGSTSKARAKKITPTHIAGLALGTVFLTAATVIIVYNFISNIKPKPEDPFPPDHIVVTPMNGRK